MKKYQPIPRVPVIMQMEATECGAASLAMICAYYKKWIPLVKVREDCGVSRDGSNAGKVCKAARKYGLKANGYRKRADDLENLPMPAVIFCLGCHFTVLKGFRGDHVYINDPEHGMVTMTRKEFSEFYSGIILCFEKTDDFVPQGRPESIWKFVFARLQGMRLPFILFSLIGAMTVFANALPPLLGQLFMSRILPYPYNGEMKAFFASALCVFVLQVLFSMLSAWYMIRIRARMAIVSNSMFLWHTLRLPVNFFLQRSLGDLVARQDANETVAQTMFTQLVPSVLNACMAVVFGCVMFTYDPILAAVAIGAVLINVAASYVVSSIRTNLMKVQARDSGMLAGFTMSGIGMMETIKATGSEHRFFENWSGYCARANEADIHFSEKNQYLSTLPGMIYQLSNLLILILGAYLMIRGSFTLGMLLGFQGYMGRFFVPVLQLQATAQNMMEMRNSMERIDDVLQYHVDVQEEDSCEEDDAIKVAGSVTFSSVSFGYSKLEEPLLKDFSVSVPKGTSVAIVGVSGSGKSTVAKLLSGLYEPWAGEVQIDEKKRSTYPRGVLTESIAMVDQTISLFEDTVMNNIRMWDDTIPDEQIYQAAMDACIHEDIMRRGAGYEYMLSENGKNLSGGQRQRIEIARALAGNPKILILDEATSALDAKTEQEVMGAIRARGITLIIVAHRLSTIRDCQQILVLQNGRIVEQGTHDELIAVHGAYAEMIASQ